jgi:hypothetical protein
MYMFTTFQSASSTLSRLSAAAPASLSTYYATAWAAYDSGHFNTSNGTWTDQSPNGRNLTLVSGTTPTTTTLSNASGTSGTITVVDNDGTARYNFGNSSMANYTLFIISRQKSTAGGSIFISNAGTTNICGYWSNLGPPAWQPNASFVVNTNLYNTNLFEMTIDNTTFYSNGTSRGTYNGSLNAGFSIYNGANGAKAWQICEMILFNTTLTSTDRTAIEGLLRTKWSINT